MKKLKTIEQIKDEVAVKYGFDNWNEVSKNDLFYDGTLDGCLIGYEDMLNEAYKLYTIQEVKKHLEIASKYAEYYRVGEGFEIDKESITGIKIELT